MNRNDKLSIAPHVMARQVGNETVILDLGGGNYYGLDRVGSRVWQLIAEGKILGEACDILQHEFDVAPETLERDVLELAENLLAQKLIAVA
jgi:hypothetical protein